MSDPGRRALAYTSLAHFVNDGNFFLFPVLIAYYESIPGTKVVALGSVAIIYNVLSGFLSTPLGRYADRHDRDSLLIFTGLLLNAVSVLIFMLPFVYHSLLFPLIITGSVVLGVAQSFYHPLGASVLSHVYDKPRASKAMGTNQAFGSLGRAVTPYLISSLILIGGEVLGLGIFAVYMFAASFVTLAGLHFFSRSRFAVAQGKPGVEQQPTVEPFSRYSGFVYFLTAVVFIRSMFMLAVNTYVPTYMSDIYHSKYLMSSVLSAGLIVSVAGGPIFGRVTASRGGRTTILVTSGISALAFLAFMLTRDIYITGVAYAVFAMTAFTGFPVLMGYVNEVVPRRFSTTSNGLVWGLGNTVGGAAGIGVMSLLLLYLPLGRVLYIMIAFAAVSFALTPLLPSKKKVSAASASGAR
ncbi:MFS transporter [Thermogymnomonas acidicola]|uniref:MFS transporter n=1 Tax=Thermogymnomonas acidicola TaxID=399579 RepID=A0AA37FCJ0_9ARCH|nr:MFS transporter [Thermogymnomonas acidicola]GGM79113.1 MFS transporter [Thermogymnomonas acidicola]